MSSRQNPHPVEMPPRVEYDGCEFANTDIVMPKKGKETVNRALRNLHMCTVAQFRYEEPTIMALQQLRGANRFAKGSGIVLSAFLKGIPECPHEDVDYCPSCYAQQLQGILTVLHLILARSGAPGRPLSADFHLPADYTVARDIAEWWDVLRELGWVWVGDEEPDDFWTRSFDTASSGERKVEEVTHADLERELTEVFASLIKNRRAADMYPSYARDYYTMVERVIMEMEAEFGTYRENGDSDEYDSGSDMGSDSGEYDSGSDMGSDMGSDSGEYDSGSDMGSDSDEYDSGSDPDSNMGEEVEVEVDVEVDDDVVYVGTFTPSDT